MTENVSALGKCVRTVPTRVPSGNLAERELAWVVSQNVRLATTPPSQQRFRCIEASAHAFGDGRTSRHEALTLGIAFYTCSKFHAVSPTLPPQLLNSLKTVSQPSMVSNSQCSLVCLECGKVCRSQGGLTQHSAVHKRYPRVTKFGDDSTRLFHPKLDGELDFLFGFMITVTCVPNFSRTAVQLIWRLPSPWNSTNPPAAEGR